MGCENLKNITLPDTVKVIENLAFYSCKKLEKFSVPKNVTKLGQETFLNCYNLKEFAFNKKLDIIEQGMFSHCMALEHIEIPGNIKEISDSAFNTCLGLKNITFNEGLEKICDHVFCGCKIKTLSFPSTLKLIGHETFWLADNIEEVLLKNKKNKGDFNCIIFGDAFKDCDTIKNFFVPEYISYSSVDFYNKNKDKICFLEDLDIDKLIESKRSLNNINTILTDAQRILEK